MIGTSADANTLTISDQHRPSNFNRISQTDHRLRKKLSLTSLAVLHDKCKKVNILSTASLCDVLSTAVAVTSFVDSLRFTDSELDLVYSFRQLLGNGLSMRSALTVSDMLNSHSVFGNGRPSDSFC